MTKLSNKSTSLHKWRCPDCGWKGVPYAFWEWKEVFNMDKLRKGTQRPAIYQCGICGTLYRKAYGHHYYIIRHSNNKKGAKYAIIY